MITTTPLRRIRAQPPSWSPRLHHRPSSLLSMRLHPIKPPQCWTFHLDTLFLPKLISTRSHLRECPSLRFRLRYLSLRSHPNRDLTVHTWTFSPRQQCLISLLDSTDTPAVPDRVQDDPRPDENAEPSAVSNEKKSSWKSTALATAMLLLRGVAGANAAGETAGSSLSLTGPDSRAIASSRDEEGGRVNANISQAHSRDRSQPKPIQTNEDDDDLLGESCFPGRDDLSY